MGQNYLLADTKYAARSAAGIKLRPSTSRLRPLSTSEASALAVTSVVIVSIPSDYTAYNFSNRRSSVGRLRKRTHPGRRFRPNPSYTYDQSAAIW